MGLGARSMANNNVPFSSIDPKASIESVKLGMSYGPNRSGNAKQPMANNFVNRSLQGGLPTQADSLSYAAAHPQNENGDETIHT